MQLLLVIIAPEDLGENAEAVARVSRVAVNIS